MWPTSCKRLPMPGVNVESPDYKVYFYFIVVPISFVFSATCFGKRIVHPNAQRNESFKRDIA